MCSRVGYKLVGIRGKFVPKERACFLEHVKV